MTQPVADRLRTALAQLTPSERQVGRALLADYPRAGLQSSSDLAASADVSAPTVVRFARALGFAGYRELQSALVAELEHRAASPITRYAETRSQPVGTGWFGTKLNDSIDSISTSLRDLPEANVEVAVDLLSDEKLRVHARGGRFSNFLAQYLLMHLHQVRRNVSAPSVPLTPGLAFTIDAGRHDLFVLYDVRRYQQSTTELAQRLAERGSRVIVVTDPWLSPAANRADVVLPTSVGTSSAFDSLASAFVLTELLVNAVLQRLGDDALQRITAWDEASGYETLP
ncbi:MAG TPA: MurR/RpiR family transcriptional regulator [Segeticoccus sp.]|uniref:MurR/RpiR family transcriptional regulator n=1 Tax=Segeticoccus sp. TaxID=2706531 RepID=UPI002D7F9EF0|nr:MurR/RpiR family transcriptional regulator [Segeticoccus sp.]HET8598855.1 MurR/RpiR family transcriptional regulator [Segeticoccus sp.]